jgi:hypothetical protein
LLKSVYNCWYHKGVHLGAGKRLLHWLILSLLLQREKLHMLISSCSAVQAADGCTRAKTLFWQVKSLPCFTWFYLVLPKKSLVVRLRRSPWLYDSLITIALFLHWQFFCYNQRLLNFFNVINSFFLHLSFYLYA